MVKMIIDASNGIFGRLCGFAAKKALQGNEIIIVNSENAIITGNKKNIIEKYQILRKKGGTSLKGPKYSKIPYMMLKRGIRGMLPNHRRGQGKLAFSRTRCYSKIPTEFEGQKMIKAGHSKPKKFITLKELSEKL